MDMNHRGVFRRGEVFWGNCKLGVHFGHNFLSATGCIFQKYFSWGWGGGVNTWI